MKVSVIIPFYNSENFIPTCIEALHAQSFFSKEFEIIFVDNKSTDNSVKKFEKNLINSPFEVQILNFSDFPSSYAARNRGVKEAKGEILVFTDADCKPEPDWLEQIVNAFSKKISSKLIVAGRVELQIEDEKSMWELFDHHFHMDNTQAEKNARIATANMAVKKSFFEEIGYFDEVTSGADHKWSEKAVKAGASVKYFPDVLVMHPTRKTRDEIFKKVKRTSFGLGEMSNENVSYFINGLLKTCLRPFLLYRHYQFALSRKFEAGSGFRIKLFFLSFLIRCIQIPAFFMGVVSKK